MAENPAKRIYNLSDADLIQESDAMKDNVNTDIADLAAYGVNAATVTAFIAMRTAFVTVASDEYMLSLVIGATQAIKTARAALVNKLKALETAVIGKFGPNDYRVGGLGIGALSKQTDNQVSESALKARTTANTIIADLAGSGVDAAFVTALGTLANDLDAKIDLRVVAVKNRDNTTRDRINKGNILYKELVRLAMFGKDFYDDVNEAKYNDYVIYETSNAAGKTRNYTLADNTKTNLNFHEIEATDSFTTTGDPTRAIELYFGSTTNSDPTGPVTTIAAGTLVTLTALQMGWEEEKPFLMARNNGTGGTVVGKTVIA